MALWGLMDFRALAVGAMVLLSMGCQSLQPQPQGAVSPVEPAMKGSVPERITIPVPVAWGGEVRCGAQGCLLAAVEHEAGAAVVHRLEGRASKPIGKHPVAYHPDSAVWLEDDLFVAAVEATSSLDVFHLEGNRLQRIQQIVVGFSPRDVVLARAEQGRYTLLATPYSGKDVAWVEWAREDSVPAQVRKVRWCEAPWHPVAVDRLPGRGEGGFAVACLDDHKVIAVPKSDVLAKPQTLATFPVIARNTRPSPSGQWLYVSLETGGQNARIHMESGELQWVASPLIGSVAVAPLADDLVVWSDDGWLYIQRLDAQGKVLETRWLKASGFATGLQVLDVDGDSERDVVVYNSSDSVIDVIYGPLWDRAVQRP